MEGKWKASYEHRAAYNRNMNRLLYDALKGVTAKALSRDRGSWFGSLAGLLNHLVVTDIHWLDRYRNLDAGAPVLNDGRLAAFPLEWKPLSEEFTVLSEARTVLDEMISEWFAWFPENSYAKEFTYEDSGGDVHRVTASRSFDFLFMHQTYHRGQISQILDEIGLPHSFADNGIFEAEE